MKRAILPALIALALSACGGSGGSDDRQSGGNRESRIVDLADPDGEGLGNSVETDGWIMDVDSRGYGLDVIDRLESRTATSDPQLVDTDGDGLSDFHELRVYKSSPISKDRDGEARMVQNGERVGVPNAILFDGEEVLSLLTSPLDPDTDGDGLTDLEELTFGSATRALIADVPQIRVDVYSNPSIAHSGTIVDSAGNEQQVGSSFSEGRSISTTSGRTNTRSSSTVVNKSRTAGGSVSAGFPWSASVEGHYEPSHSKTTSFGMERTSFYDQTRASEMARELSEVMSRSSNREVTCTGGSVEIMFDLSNEGDLPVTLSETEIAALQFDRNDREQLIPIGMMVPQGSGEWSLGIQATSYSNIAGVTLDSPSVIENLPTNREGMHFRV